MNKLPFSDNSVKEENEPRTPWIQWGITVFNKSLTITDNIAESLRINFDGERFALVHTNKAKAVTKTIILNPREAQEIARFIIAPEEL